MIWQVTEGSPMAVWLLGGEGRQLRVDQFMLQDGRSFRTKEAHEHFIKVCCQLGDKELAWRVFSVNHAASVEAKENNGWKPTLVSLLEDIQRACIEHGHGRLWNTTGYDIKTW